MSTELDLGWLDPSLAALQRLESGMGSGLCRAIAARMGVDVVLVRVAFSLLALSGGLGVALYVWGTALTRGATGVRPIDTLLPAFARWTPVSQKAAVILTTLVAVGLITSITPLPWGPGVLLLALLVLARRGRLGGAWTPPAASQQRQQGHGAVSDDALVSQWRSQMQSAAGRPADSLPVVDLYAPEAPRATAPTPRPKAAWLIGVAIFAVMLATGALVTALLGGPIPGLGAALVAGGSLAVLYAVVARAKRIPRPLLGVLVVAMVVAGWLAPHTSATVDPVMQEPGVLALTAVGRQGVVDLRDADLSDVETLRIDAIASDVTVILPGAPVSMTTQERVSEVRIVGSESSTPLDFTVTVDATLSRVTLEETP